MKYHSKDDTSNDIITPIVWSPPSSPSILKKDVKTPTRTTVVTPPPPPSSSSSSSSRSMLLANKYARRKVVSFQRDVSVVMIQPIYEIVLEHNSTVVHGDGDEEEFFLTYEEVLKLLWFTPEEYCQSFKDAKLEEQKEEQEYEFSCLRGIPTTSSGSTTTNRRGRRTLKQRRENSKQVRISVLFDQKFLRESGVNGAALLLAGRYSRRCVTSKHEALLIGLRHARDVVDNDLLSRKTTILKQQEHFARIRAEDQQPQEPPQLVILTHPYPHDDFKREAAAAPVPKSQEREEENLHRHNEKQQQHLTNHYVDNHIHHANARHRSRRKRYLRRANMLLSVALAS